MSNEINAIIPPFTFVLDPNAQKNRIPTEAELTALKTLKGAHSHLLSHLRDEMKRAETAYESILARFQQQLHESRKALQLMEEQCNALQTEISRLAGMTHPIRRYSTDMLQYIFEFVHDLGGPRPLQTTRDLSQVCQRWRTIVYDSPRLWTKIKYRMNRKDSDISIFWRRIIPRMKAVPPTIVIWGFAADSVDRLKHLNLSLIPVIQSLELVLRNPRNFDLLRALGEVVPSAQVKSVHIRCDGAGGAFESDTQCGLGSRDRSEDDFVSSELTLSAACTLQLTPSNNFGSVTTLKLNYLRDVNIPLILSLFGQLINLELDKIGTCPTSGEPVISSSLKCLVVNIDSQENGRAWLAQVLCPNLTSLHCEASKFPKEWVSFVQMHPSLDILDYTSGDKLVPRLAPVASQIQHLHINAREINGFIHWKRAGMPEPPFPTIKTIRISVCSELRDTELETLIRTRCLPRHHPDCEVPTNLVPLASLSIMNSDDSDKFEDTKLRRTSELFKEAQKTVIFDIIWEITGIRLSWT